MKKRIFALFLSVLLLATVLCACGDTKQEETGGVGSDGTSSSGAVVDGGEMVVGIAQDLGDSLDPYQMTAAGTREVLFNIYEGLVKPNASGEYVPAVASDSTVSEDGLTEAVCLPGKKFVWAVQWHPEFSFRVNEDSRKIFGAFVGHC